MHGRSYDWRIYPHKCGQFVGASDERSGESSEGRALNDSHGLCMEDLFTGESTLIDVVNWLWLQMTIPQQETSPLGSIIHYPLQTG